MPSPQEYAAHWLQQSVSPALGEDPFLRFMTAWIGFNALYAEQSKTVDGDRNQVREFAKDDDLVQRHSMLLRDKDFPDYRKAVEVLGAQGVLDLRKGRRHHISNNKLLLEVLECVYQVRCNCMHGGKHQADQRDRDLVTAGFVVVANLLSFYLAGRRVGGWTELLERIDIRR
jgi:hypothetical protein